MGRFILHGLLETTGSILVPTSFVFQITFKFEEVSVFKLPDSRGWAVFRLSVLPSVGVYLALALGFSISI